MITWIYYTLFVRYRSIFPGCQDTSLCMIPRGPGESCTVRQHDSALAIAISIDFFELFIYFFYFSYSRAEALQSIIQLMGAHEFYELYKDDNKVHSVDWTLAKAQEVLQTWQRKYTEVQDR